MNLRKVKTTVWFDKKHVVIYEDTKEQFAFRKIFSKDELLELSAALKTLADQMEI